MFVLSVSDMSADCVRCQKIASLELFDTQVQRVLLFSAEMWGLSIQSNVERVHTFACKRYFPLTVPNRFV